MFAATLPLHTAADLPPCCAGAKRTAWKPAGIDDKRFICLSGRSGGPYMFCRINRDRATLHADCLFAVTDVKGTVQCVTPNLPDKLAQDARIYVHLPDDAPLDAVLVDLT